MLVVDLSQRGLNLICPDKEDERVQLEADEFISFGGALSSEKLALFGFTTAWQQPMPIKFIHCTVRVRWRQKHSQNCVLKFNKQTKTISRIASKL